MGSNAEKTTPIAKVDPWRRQFFTVVWDRLAEVSVPMKDDDAWLQNPTHRWVYDKLAVACSQGLDAAPHGVVPPSFPVFSKPIYNLKNMGAGSRTIASLAEYREAETAGHFWTTLLTGTHISSDIAVIDGEPKWWRHTTGDATDGGTFDHWEIHHERNAAVEDRCGAWCRKHLKNYTGMANFETIGSRIIEVHLRPGDMWPDLYGVGWVEAIVRLYEERQWHFDDHDRRTGYCVPLFMPHGKRYNHPPAAMIDELKKSPAISSIQVTFYEDRAPHLHSMPPGGFQVVVVNCWDRNAGNIAREALRRYFEASSTTI